MQGPKHASVAGPPSHRCMTNELGREPGELGDGAGGASVEGLKATEDYRCDSFQNFGASFQSL